VDGGGNEGNLTMRWVVLVLDSAIECADVGRQTRPECQRWQERADDIRASARRRFGALARAPRLCATLRERLQAQQYPGEVGPANVRAETTRRKTQLRVAESLDPQSLLPEAWEQ
jgi:hypothetical protein